MTTSEDLYELLDYENNYCTACNKRFGGIRIPILHTNSSTGASMGRRRGLRSQRSQIISSQEISICELVDELVEERVLNAARRYKWASVCKKLTDRVMASVTAQPFYTGVFKLFYDQHIQQFKVAVNGVIFYVCKHVGCWTAYDIEKNLCELHEKLQT